MILSLLIILDGTVDDDDYCYIKSCKEENRNMETTEEESLYFELCQRKFLSHKKNCITYRFALWI